MKRIGPFHWVISVVVYFICWTIIWPNTTFVWVMVPVSLAIEAFARHLGRRANARVAHAKAAAVPPPAPQWPSSNDWSTMDWPK